MFSKNDLLFNPEAYEPLGSFKAVRNKENPVDYVNMNMNNVFLSEPNMQLVSQSLYKTGRAHGFNKDPEFYYVLVKKLAIEFVKEKGDLQGYIMSDARATQQNDWVEALKAINKDLLEKCYNYFNWNQFNPFRAYADVGDAQNRRQVKYSELLAHEIPTIAVWQPLEVKLIGKKYRADNRPYKVREHAQYRFYDRSNEGFKHGESSRASLDNPIYGYNMEPIINSLHKWERDSWFGI